MALHALPHDVWVSVGQFLSPQAVCDLSSTCSQLQERLNSNEGLWRLQAANRWRSCSAYGLVDDWSGLYRAGHMAAARLSTREPWSASIPRCPGSESPYSAHLLIKHSSTAYRAPPSSLSPISTVSSRPSPLLTPPDVIAAAMDNRLHFWVWPPPPTPTAAAADNVTQQHFCSAPQGGHTATIDALVEVPTRGGAIGFASGARDHTVKLWAPFQSSSSGSSSCGGGAVGLVRPVRTLRGHTGSVTSLATIRTGAAAAGGDSGAASCFSVLASASTDKTIRLWDLSALLQLPPSAASSSGSSSSQQRAVRGTPGMRSALGRQQHGHGALCATLRGHSDAVTSILRWDEDPTVGTDSSAGVHSASLPSGCGLVSSSRDSKVKLWDVAEGRNACVATWKMPQHALQVLDGLYLQGCLVIRMPSALQVIDVRAPPPSGGGGHLGVATVSWPNCHIAAAAAHGTAIAAGGCKGVRAWDLRMVSSNSGSGSGGNNGSSSSGGGGIRSELLSSRMPNSERVTLLHMDRVQLVAATSTSRLHSPASIAVWSLPCGRRVQLLSSTLSAVTLHGRDTVMPRDELATARATAYQLMESMSAADANRVLALLHQQHIAQHQHQQQAAAAAAGGGGAAGGAQQQQQADGQQQGQDSPHGSISSSTSGSLDGSLLTGQWDDQTDIDGDELDPDAFGGADDGYDDDASGDSDNDDDSISDSLVRGVFDAFGDQQQQQQTEGATRSSSVRASSRGRIEPGVISMAVQGGVIVCVDTQGNVLLRDFATGTPTHKQVRAFVAAGRVAEAAASRPGSSGPAGSSRQGDSSADGAAAPGAAAGGSSAGAGADEEQQQHPASASAAQVQKGSGSMPASKFWQA